MNRLEFEFIKVYTEAVDSADLLPSSESGRRNLLELLMLERALREAESDLATRPDWAVIPLAAILRLVTRPDPATT